MTQAGTPVALWRATFEIGYRLENGTESPTLGHGWRDRSNRRWLCLWSLCQRRGKGPPL